MRIVVFLLTGGENFWWCNFAKMVDYIALNKYIISDVSENSEAKKEILKTEKGILLSNNLEEDIENLYRHFSNNLLENNLNDYYKTYLASSQVKSFVEIFNTLLEKKQNQMPAMQV